jgi:arylsulfatase A-like enzyme
MCRCCLTSLPANHAASSDVVEELDKSVGTVLQTLRDEKLAEKTLVIFTSDNGPWLTFGDQGGSAGLLRDGKGSTWEGGMREPAIAWRPGTVPAGAVYRELASTLDLLPTFCAQAGASVPQDRPLDGYDISPALAGGKSPRNEMFYYRAFDLMAVRMGPWKAHFTQTGYGQPQPESTTRRCSSTSKSIRARITTSRQSIPTCSPRFRRGGKHRAG